MAKTYYDSNYFGAQIDAAVAAAGAIAEVAVTGNAGKIIMVDDDGNLTAVSISDIIENGDAVSY